MSKQVLLIRREETFMVNTIRRQIEKNGIPYIESALTVKEINGSKDKAEVMLLYADENVSENRDALVFIKDLLLEEEKELIIAGGRNELDEVEKIIPEELLTGIYERPFDMNSLIDHVGSYMDEQSVMDRKKMILVVDDDPTYLRMVKEWLKDHYRVSLANSGMQAITWLANNKADLVLLDYEMPTIKGSTLLQMLRSEARLCAIPVMFLTGKSDKESIMEVLALKPAGYLLKTIDRKSLLSAIDKFFVKRRYNH